SGQQVFYPFPRLVAYIVPVNAFIFFHASHFTSFPLSSPHYLESKQRIEGKGEPLCFLNKQKVCFVWVKTIRESATLNGFTRDTKSTCRGFIRCL
ncbi:hypothetical protein, partial [Treponema endosymbiont of Eucomonympha sp.]|uniref:hypothetical protein n=1 Tax=Treponema endosymbiont of Eucomonympha sp. TaxID=1580831 RepID=UPI0016503618